MSEMLKATYDEANRLHKQATSILDEYKGKPLPAEKEAEVNRLLDEVEMKTQEAKNLERRAETEKRAGDFAKWFDDQPVTRKPVFQDTGGMGGKDEKAAKAHAFTTAMNNYLRYGEKGLTAEDYKALSVNTATEGGYLQEGTFLSELLTKQRDVSVMRRISRVLPSVPSGSVIVPTEESALSDAEWTAELATGSEDTVRPFGRRELRPRPLAKRVKVSNTLLRSPNFDVEAWIRDQFSYKFGVTEENGFLSGNGTTSPLGLLNQATGNALKIPLYTTSTSNEVFGNDILNWLYTLPSSYAGRPTTRIVCNRAFIRKVRTLVKADNTTSFTNYLWQPGLQGGTPNTIADVQYELSDKFPTGLDGNDAWSDNAIVAVVGDFRFYWIVDSLAMSVQRLSELYAEANQTGYIGRKESDGSVVLPEAFVGLKVKA